MFQFSYKNPTCEGERCYKSCLVSCWKTCIKNVKIKQISPAMIGCSDSETEAPEIEHLRDGEKRNYIFNEDI